MSQVEIAFPCLLKKKQIVFNKKRERFSWEKVLIPHEKINQGLTDINQCLTNIFKI